jgi:hypothetical protein
VQWRPALDITKLLVTAEVVVGAVLVAQRLAAPQRGEGRRDDGSRGLGQHEGRGDGGPPCSAGWLALATARTGQASQTSLPRRPLWARLLAATTLQSQLRA